MIMSSLLTRYEYHWADGTTVKKPIKCSAPKYIDYLMTWVQEQLDDENIFPSKIGMPLAITEHTLGLHLSSLYHVTVHSAVITVYDDNS